MTCSSLSLLYLGPGKKKGEHKKNEKIRKNQQGLPNDRLPSLRLFYLVSYINLFVLLYFILIMIDHVTFLSLTFLLKCISFY